MKGAGQGGGEQPDKDAKKKKVSFKNCTCKHHTFTESKTRGGNTKLHTGLQYDPPHRATVSHQCRKGNKSNDINNNRRNTDHHQIIS